MRIPRSLALVAILALGACGEAPRGAAPTSPGSVAPADPSGSAALAVRSADPLADCLATAESPASPRLASWFATEPDASSSRLLQSVVERHAAPQLLRTVEHAAGFPPRGARGQAGVAWVSLPLGSGRSDSAQVHADFGGGPELLDEQALELQRPVWVGACLAWLRGTAVPTAAASKAQARQAPMDFELRLASPAGSTAVLRTRATWLQVLGVVGGRLALYELQDDGAALRLLGVDEQRIELGAGYARDLAVQDDAFVFSWHPAGQLRRVAPGVDEVLVEGLTVDEAAILVDGPRGRRVVRSRSWNDLLAVPEAAVGPGLWLERRQSQDTVAWWLGPLRLDGAHVSLVGAR